MNHFSCKPDAIAEIKGGQAAPGLWGQVKFYQRSGHVLVSVNVKGLPENDSGFYGFHIHEGSSCNGTTFSETGGHFNPDKEHHPSHAGDLPPLLCYNGGACMCVTTDRFCLNEVIGRTVVIHGMEDDFRSQPAGDAGAKIGCGVICKG